MAQLPAAKKASKAVSYAGEAAPLDNDVVQDGIAIRPRPKFILFFIPHWTSWDVEPLDGKPTLLPVLRTCEGIPGVNQVEAGELGPRFGRFLDYLHSLGSEGRTGVQVPETYGYRRRAKTTAFDGKGRRLYCHFCAWERIEINGRGEADIVHRDHESYLRFRARLVEDGVIDPPTETELSQMRERWERRIARWGDVHLPRVRAAKSFAESNLAAFESATGHTTTQRVELAGEPDEAADMAKGEIDG